MTEKPDEKIDSDERRERSLQFMRERDAAVIDAANEREAARRIAEIDGLGVHRLGLHRPDVVVVPAPLLGEVIGILCYGAATEERRAEVLQALMQLQDAHKAQRR